MWSNHHNLQLTDKITSSFLQSSCRLQTFLRDSYSKSTPTSSFLSLNPAVYKDDNIIVQLTIIIQTPRQNTYYPSNVSLNTSSGIPFEELLALIYDFIILHSLCTVLSFPCITNPVSILPTSQSWCQWPPPNYCT